MIHLSQVCKQYNNGHEALKNVSFNVEEGEMAFILGHSGAGKSTLFKLIARIEKPTSGQIIVQDQNLNKLRNTGIPYLRREIGVIFQDHKLLYDRTVFDNVALPLIVIGMPSNEIRKRVRAALGKVGLSDHEKAYPITLSGGEQQRVAIARAISNKPQVLLADEPTGNLDPTTSSKVFQSLFDLTRLEKVSALVATHNMGLTKYMDRVLTVQDGLIVPFNR